MFWGRRARIEGRHVTFSLDWTILKDAPFDQLWGTNSESGLLLIEVFQWVAKPELIYFFYKVRHLNDSLLGDPVMQWRRSGDIQCHRYRGRGRGRDSWLKWRKCQHFHTNSWRVLKMTNRQQAGRSSSVQQTFLYLSSHRHLKFCPQKCRKNAEIFNIKQS